MRKPSPASPTGCRDPVGGRAERAGRLRDGLWQRHRRSLRREPLPGHKETGRGLCADWTTRVTALALSRLRSDPARSVADTSGPGGAGNTDGALATDPGKGPIPCRTTLRSAFSRTHAEMSSLTPAARGRRPSESATRGSALTCSSLGILGGHHSGHAGRLLEEEIGRGGLATAVRPRRDRPRPELAV